VSDELNTTDTRKKQVFLEAKRKVRDSVHSVECLVLI
jgi:hypothetical protein